MLTIIEDQPITSSATDFEVWPIIEARISYSPVNAEELDQIFSNLAKKWKDETGIYSVTKRRYAHPSYQAILQLKDGAVPLILRELQHQPDWWFEALKQLTNQDPVKAGSTFKEAVDAWIEWGKRNWRIR